MSADGCACGEPGETAWSEQLGRSVCLRCYDREAPPPPVAGPQDVALARLERHEAARERRREVIDGHPPPGVLAALQASYQRQGLRPVIDPELELIRADCDTCHAQNRDPTGSYRPLRAVPRARRRADGKLVPALLTLICDACGYCDDRSL